MPEVKEIRRLDPGVNSPHGMKTALEKRVEELEVAMNRAAEATVRPMSIATSM